MRFGVDGHWFQNESSWEEVRSGVGAPQSLPASLTRLSPAATCTSEVLDPALPGRPNMLIPWRELAMAEELEWWYLGCRLVLITESGVKRNPPLDCFLTTTAADPDCRCWCSV